MDGDAVTGIPQIHDVCAGDVFAAARHQHVFAVCGSVRVAEIQFARICEHAEHVADRLFLGNVGNLHADGIAVLDPHGAVGEVFVLKALFEDAVSRFKLRFEGFQHFAVFVEHLFGIEIDAAVGNVLFGGIGAFAAFIACDFPRILFCGNDPLRIIHGAIAAAQIGAQTDGIQKRL